MVIYAYRKERLEKTLRKMEEKGVDGIFTMGSALIKYFTGLFISPWTGGCGILINKRGDIILITALCDKDMLRVEEETLGWIKEIRTWNPPLLDIPGVKFHEAVINTFREFGLTKSLIGCIFNYLPTDIFLEVKKQLPEIEFVDCTDIIDEITSVCDNEEIELTRRACEIADAGMEAALSCVKPGISELQIASIVDKTMREKGSTYNDVTHVCSGRHILMEQWPSEKLVQRGDIIKVDLHPFYKHYWADLCCTAILGKPSEEFRKMCEVISEAAREMIEDMKPGAIVKNIDIKFRKKLKSAGYEKYARWAMGHSTSTGHRAISIHSGAENILLPNMVICANAYAFKPRGEGIMLEHLVLIKEKGAEVLNRFPLGLIEL